MCVGGERDGHTWRMDVVGLPFSSLSYSWLSCDLIPDFFFFFSALICLPLESYHLLPLCFPFSGL